MTPQDNTSSEVDLLHRSSDPANSAAADEEPQPSYLPRNVAVALTLSLILLVAAFFSARLWARHALRDSLPQLDGSVAIPGLAAPVTVQRDTHGIPHIRAANLDDLFIAQGFVTAQDRLWQMEALRRHAAGTLAELLGPTLFDHDRAQRTLQLRATADRAVAVLPADQLHFLELYARGVNASIAVQRAHLPLEFLLLRFEPAPWTPRDSLLVSLVMFQDLTSSFPTKLSRELIASRLNPTLLADLYPVGSWRDHPPSQPTVDLTTPQDLPKIPLDESQTRRTSPGSILPTKTNALLSLQQSQRTCEACTPGSNNWVVAGSHTASGKPLLSNDMHLSHGVPNTWYETSLESPTPTGAFHVAGVALPGTPFIIVGHNDHIAWGFTNLGADVQDIFVERTRIVPGRSNPAAPTPSSSLLPPTNPSANPVEVTKSTALPQPPIQEFQSPDGAWHPILHQQEIIHIRGRKDFILDVTSTQHGQLITPIISGLLGTNTGSSSYSVHPRSSAPTTAESRTLALAWTIYDPANVTDPFFTINSATDWPSLTAAFSTWGGPAQNMVYADTAGHIGYHAVGKIPIRGSILLPGPLSSVPVSGLDPAQQWSGGYIPFEQLPQAFDPPSGILATANSRVTPDLYPFPITLNWSDPYRNERIWKVLSSTRNLTSSDMLRLQTDVYSEPDHAIAQRLVYALDHAGPHVSSNPKRLHQAADLLRTWNGNVDANNPAPAIVDAARAALWPMLLIPKLGDAAAVYSWGEKTYAEEQIILHTPARWLPNKQANWDDFLAAAVENGLIEAHAPQTSEALARWTYGKTHLVDIEHPVFSISPLIDSILGRPTGTGPRPQSGDTTTVKQVSRAFGPSERLTVDLSDLDNTTLNVVLGQSGNPLSPWFLDQFQEWYQNTTQTLPYTAAALQSTTTHTLTLTPQ